jgi:hypothetical protein
MVGDKIVLSVDRSSVEVLVKSISPVGRKMTGTVVPVLKIDSLLRINWTPRVQWFPAGVLRASSVSSVAKLV